MSLLKYFMLLELSLRKEFLTCKLRSKVIRIKINTENKIINHLNRD